MGTRLQLNFEALRELVAQAYLPHAHVAFGERGTKAAVTLLNWVKLFYQKCPPDELRGPLTILVGIEATPAAPTIGDLGKTIDVATIEAASDVVLAARAVRHVIVEAVADGTFRIIVLEEEVDLSFLAQRAVVYHYDSAKERILAKEFDDHLVKVSPAVLSNFAVPTFSSLEDALVYYSKNLVLHTQCRLLAGIWAGGVDGPRLVLVNKPETQMRDSLAHTLGISVRDATVRPEQNTDETKPVDIRVDWFGSGASALIEVKWLGRSIAISRKPGPTPTYTDYSQSRAQDGANQLADYMDRERRHTKATAPRGYLVVFDARRRNVGGPSDRLSKADARHFADAIIPYNPDHSSNRDDFAPPVRFFIEPRETHFVTA